ncbi:MAG: YdcF family protein [Oscillatoriophycideae cyanobacterium NC_groundwater_1537_Pr4_S-0.65um_50_18]|nr:YdcF family protein [Oscillatoriophycideae cyanobacterium NC_groundwater_1537_Pr4_S-0.65um_50_18]
MTISRRSHEGRFLSGNRLFTYLSAPIVRLLGALIVIAGIGYIPVRLTIATYHNPTPQAILTLGGRPARETFTAEFAALYPHLQIWVSSGLRPNDARSIFQSEGVSETRVHLDYRASDTVTNFTTLVSDLEQQHIHHIYLITSDYHMPRAIAIATVILGSHGIAFTPIAVPSERAPESQLHVARDVARSFFWLATGKTGASLNPKL